MRVELNSPCKVNLILNILGKRLDGFHELETVMQPVRIFDQLRIEEAPSGVALSCNNPALPTDAGNLVYRAAQSFLQAASIQQGARIHLEKRIPLAAGLGGGSGNAALTLLGLNQVFGFPLGESQLHKLASALGSDVPFFLQDKPALATGRGEQVQSLKPFQALQGKTVILVHPGFGVSTAWAYKNLARYPEALNGKAGRAARLVENLQRSLAEANADFYNSLEAPVLPKFPLLCMFQEFFQAEGALLSMMSGSGSTTFAFAEGTGQAEELIEKFRRKFGEFCWIGHVPLS